MSERILIIEDEQPLKRLCQMELEDEGYEVTTVAKGKQAVKKLNEEQIDLVVLDLALPDADGTGLDYLQEFMKADRQVKVVIHSANPNYKLDFHTWIADAFVPKSSDFSKLKHTIDDLLHEQ